MQPTDSEERYRDGAGRMVVLVAGILGLVFVLVLGVPITHGIFFG